MKGFDLTQEELQELRAAHKAAIVNKDAKSAYKLNALILLGSGWKIDEVVEALLFDNNTLRNYVNQYRSGGFSELLKNNYKGSTPKLSDDQIQELCAELDARIFPTTQAIAFYIKFKFGIEYTISGLTDLLKRLDFVYKKPKLIPGNPDQQLQDEFLQQYLDFMKNKGKNDAVFFVDAVHPTHNTMPAYGWMRKGRETEIQSNSARSRLNIHGAMNAETFETTIISGEENINTDSTINLLEYLIILYPLAKRIYVILDNAKYHYSIEVQEWVKNNSKIKLVFLPSYSPEYNLIERLWRVFKKNVLYNKYYKTFSEFKDSCIAFFANQKNYRDQICSIMGDGLAALA